MTRLETFRQVDLPPSGIFAGTARQQAYAYLVALGHDPQRAAMEAGYSFDVAMSQHRSALGTPAVLAEIERLRALGRDGVLREIRHHRSDWTHTAGNRRTSNRKRVDAMVLMHALANTDHPRPDEPATDHKETPR